MSLHHTGTVFLSRRQRPRLTVAADGTQALTMLAFDRIGPLQVESYLLTWTGRQAVEFWQAHAAQMVPGAALEVVLEHARVHVQRGRHTDAQLVAQVVELELLPSKAGEAAAKKAFSPCADYV